jgi:hypothetical protein
MKYMNEQRKVQEDKKNRVYINDMICNVIKWMAKKKSVVWLNEGYEVSEDNYNTMVGFIHVKIKSWKRNWPPEPWQRFRLPKCEWWQTLPTYKFPYIISTYFEVWPLKVNKLGFVFTKNISPYSYFLSLTLIIRFMSKIITYIKIYINV